MTTTTTGAATAGSEIGALWDRGDYAAIGVRIASVAEDLCETADVRGGADVLDVGTGNGNAALCAARRDARVIGVDLAPGLLERARDRRDSEDLDIEFALGDAEALDFGDDRFDVVLSCVGVQFAADQSRAAAELVRVCRPGGRIALANWSPNDLWTELPPMLARHDGAPPPGAPSPMTWGTADGLRDLFGDDVALEIGPRTFRYRFATVERYVDLMVSSFPPFLRIAAQLDHAGRMAFADDLHSLVDQWNEASDGTLVLPLTYIIALVDLPR